ncbi:MAG: chloramphenicol acetyltransferase [Alphaproteobacteria bacterium]|nr:chloramphenicol acetyltransferase [Alphaproteobacteria bacterium]
MTHPALVNPKQLFPFGTGARHTVFLKPLLDEITPPRTHLSAGDYSYYSDFEDPTRFFIRNVRYDFGFSGTRLDIGRYCAFAHDTTFVMSDANHAIAGPSTYPFPVFGGAWAAEMATGDYPAANKGSINVGNDVWCGYKSVIMPGVTIGSGAIVAACAVVTRDVPPYSMVAGNPARVVKMRFEPDDVSRLLELAWWDWPAESVAAAVPVLVKGDVAGLAAFKR